MKRLSNRPILIFDDSLSCIVPLSAGAFGTVSKGIYNDGVTRIDVAIKSLLRFNAEKLKQDAEVARKLYHPNVLSLIGICYDTANNQIKLVMPYMVNGDLARFLTELRCASEEGTNASKIIIEGKLLRSCALQVARGMSYLVPDDQGYPSIIQSDLAASNCMVDENIIIKVADFGLSRQLDSCK